MQLIYDIFFPGCSIGQNVEFSFHKKINKTKKKKTYFKFASKMIIQFGQMSRLKINIHFLFVCVIDLFFV